jgi:hypothetical protein
LTCGDVPAPSNVQAGDGDPGGVLVSWSAVTGAAEYRVYRNTSDTSASASAVSAWITDTEFFDESAAGLGGGGGGCAQPPGDTTLYYWVVARTASECESPFSASDTGSVPIITKAAGISTAPHAAADMLLVAICIGTAIHRRPRFIRGPRTTAS